MNLKISLTFLLFNLFFHLSATDTLLVGIKDLGTPIRSMVQNEVGEIFIQLGDQVFKLENEKLLPSIRSLHEWGQEYAEVEMNE